MYLNVYNRWYERWLWRAFLNLLLGFYFSEEMRFNLTCLAVFIFNYLHFKQDYGCISSCFSVLRILGILQSIPETINIYLTASRGYLALFASSDPRLMNAGSLQRQNGVCLGDSSIEVVSFCSELCRPAEKCRRVSKQRGDGKKEEKGTC